MVCPVFLFGGGIWRWIPSIGEERGYLHTGWRPAQKGQRSFGEFSLPELSLKGSFIKKWKLLSSFIHSFTSFQINKTRCLQNTNKDICTFLFRIFNVLFRILGLNRSIHVNNLYDSLKLENCDFLDFQSMNKNEEKILKIPLFAFWRWMKDVWNDVRVRKRWQIF